MNYEYSGLDFRKICEVLHFKEKPYALRENNRVPKESSICFVELQCTAMRTNSNNRCRELGFSSNYILIYLHKIC